MKMTWDLPPEVEKDVNLRAVHEGKKLKEIVAELLREALTATDAAGATVVTAAKESLKHRKEVARKFVTGEWGLDLAGYESTKTAGRKSASARAKAWRS
jgi:hypothetical protein